MACALHAPIHRVAIRRHRCESSRAAHAIARPTRSIGHSRIAARARRKSCQAHSQHPCIFFCPVSGRDRLAASLVGGDVRPVLHHTHAQLPHPVPPALWTERTRNSTRVPPALCTTPAPSTLLALSRPPSAPRARGTPPARGPRTCTTLARARCSRSPPKCFGGRGRGSRPSRDARRRRDSATRFHRSPGRWRDACASGAQGEPRPRHEGSPANRPRSCHDATTSARAPQPRTRRSTRYTSCPSP